MSDQQGSYIRRDSHYVNLTWNILKGLTTYPNIWAVLLILLETQDVNTS